MKLKTKDLKKRRLTSEEKTNHSNGITLIALIITIIILLILARSHYKHSTRR